MEALYRVWSCFLRGEFLPSVGVDVETEMALELEAMGLLEIHDEHGDQPPVSLTSAGKEELRPVIKRLIKLERQMKGM